MSAFVVFAIKKPTINVYYGDQIMKSSMLIVVVVVVVLVVVFVSAKAKLFLSIISKLGTIYKGSTMN